MVSHLLLIYAKISSLKERTNFWLTESAGLQVRMRNAVFEMEEMGYDNVPKKITFPSPEQVPLREMMYLPLLYEDKECQHAQTDFRNMQKLAVFYNDQIDIWNTWVKSLWFVGNRRCMPHIQLWGDMRGPGGEPNWWPELRDFVLVVEILLMAFVFCLVKGWIFPPEIARSVLKHILPVKYVGKIIQPTWEPLTPVTPYCPTISTSKQSSSPSDPQVERLRDKYGIQGNWRTSSSEDADFSFPSRRFDDYPTSLKDFLRDLGLG